MFYMLVVYSYVCPCSHQVIASLFLAAPGEQRAEDRGVDILGFHKCKWFTSCCWCQGPMCWMGVQTCMLHMISLSCIIFTSSRLVSGHLSAIERRNV
jgi:hypothetical protein